MQAAILFALTAVIFLAIDAVMLRKVMRPLFEVHLGDWLLKGFRAGPAVAFYLFYIAGLVWMVSWPALQAGAPMQALIGGAVIGAMAFGTYEFTNYATLRKWSPQMVVVDLAWGIVLTGGSAWAGVALILALT